MEGYLHGSIHRTLAIDFDCLSTFSVYCQLVQNNFWKCTAYCPVGFLNCQEIIASFKLFAVVSLKSRTRQPFHGVFFFATLIARNNWSMALPVPKHDWLSFEGFVLSQSAMQYFHDTCFEIMVCRKQHFSSWYGKPKNRNWSHYDKMLPHFRKSVSGEMETLSSKTHNSTRTHQIFILTQTKIIWTRHFESGLNVLEVAVPGVCDRETEWMSECYSVTMCVNSHDSSQKFVTQWWKNGVFWYFHVYYCSLFLSVWKIWKLVAIFSRFYWLKTKIFLKKTCV